MDGNSSSYPEYWDLKEHGALVGVIRGFSEASTKFGPAVVVEVELDDGTHRSLWLTSTVLKSKFGKARPREGERVSAEYLGERDGANGPYGDFDVEFPDRPPYVPNWTALGDADDEDGA